MDAPATGSWLKWAFYIVPSWHLLSLAQLHSPSSSRSSSDGEAICRPSGGSVLSEARRAPNDPSGSAKGLGFGCLETQRASPAFRPLCPSCCEGSEQTPRRADIWDGSPPPSKGRGRKESGAHAWVAWLAGREQSVSWRRRGSDKDQAWRQGGVWSVEAPRGAGKLWVLLARGGWTRPSSGNWSSSADSSEGCSREARADGRVAWAPAGRSAGGRRARMGATSGGAAGRRDLEAGAAGERSKNPNGGEFSLDPTRIMTTPNLLLVRSSRLSVSLKARVNPSGGGKSGDLQGLGSALCSVAWSLSMTWQRRLGSWGRGRYWEEGEILRQPGVEKVKELGLQETGQPEWEARKEP